MNDNVRKVFEILGVEPNEKFRIKSNDDCIFDGYYKFDENLILRYYDYDYDNRRSTLGLADLLNGDYKIIKLPKKKKLRDLTVEEYRQWKNKNCDGECNKCLFNLVQCYVADNGWVNHKDLYSDKFLDQEVEIPE